MVWFRLEFLVQMYPYLTSTFYASTVTIQSLLHIHKVISFSKKKKKKIFKNIKKILLIKKKNNKKFKNTKKL